MTLLPSAHGTAALLQDDPSDVDGRRAGAADRALMLLLAAREQAMDLDRR